MPTFLSEIMSQLRNIWAQLSGGQRATMVSVVAATVVGIAALVFFATRPDYVAFGNGVAADGDKMRVIQALDEKGIDYRMEQGVILVNGSQRSDAEKALEAKGLRGASGGGNEVSGLTQGRDQRRWHLQQKKLIKVEKQLRTINGVRTALVNYWDPSGPNLLRAREARRASVMLDLQRPEDFGTIANVARGIVANSLGIKRDDVQVTDSNSQMLHGSTGNAAGSFPHFNLQSKQSSLLTMRAREMLERLWPGKTYVSVIAEYENEITESEEKIVSPEKVVTDTKSYKTKDTTASAAKGDPNSVGTTRNDSAASAGGPEKNSSVTQVHTSFEPIIGHRSRKALAPGLKRLSISLTIDESLSGKKVEIESQVKNAVGWVEGRDSDVAAMVNKFDEIEVLPVAGGTMDMVREWGPLAGQILSVLLVLFFLRGLLKSNKTVIKTEAAKAKAEATAASEKEESTVEQSVRLRKEIEKAVADDPASVSRLLESWLANKEPA